MSLGAEPDTPHPLHTHFGVKPKSLDDSTRNLKNAISPSEMWPFGSINPKPKSVKSQCRSPHVWVVKLLCLWVPICILDFIPSSSDNIMDPLVDATVSTTNFYPLLSITHYTNRVALSRVIAAWFTGRVPGFACSAQTGLAPTSVDLATRQNNYARRMEASANVRLMTWLISTRIIITIRADGLRIPRGQQFPKVIL